MHLSAPIVGKYTGASGGRRWGAEAWRHAALQLNTSGAGAWNSMLQPPWY